MPNPIDLDTLGELEASFLHTMDWRQLIQLYEENQDLAGEVPDYWGRLAQHLRQLSTSIDPPEERSHVLMQAGQLRLDKLDDSDSALEDFKESFKVWPTNLDALRKAGSIYREKQNWDKVLQLLTFELERSDSHAEHADVLCEIGRIFIEDLNQPGRAIQRLELVLTLVADHELATSLLEKARELAPDYNEMSDIPVLSAAFEDESDFDIDVDASAEPIPEPVNTITDDGTDEPTEMLEPDQPSDDSEDPATVEPRDDAEEAPLPDDPELAAATLLDWSRTAAYQYDNGDSEQDLSLGHYERLLTIQPSHQVGRLEFASRLAIHSDHERRFSLVEGQADQTSDPSLSARLGAEALLASAAMGDEEAALSAAQARLSEDATDPTALYFMKAWYQARQDWEPLRELYEGAVAARRRGDKTFDAPTELADLLWQHLGDHEKAEIIYKRLRLSDPKNPRMLAFYSDFHRRAGDYKRLITALKSMRAQEANRQRWLDIALEMADVAENQLKQPDRAIDEWKTIAREFKGSEQAGQALRRLYTASQKYNALLEYLKVELDNSASDTERTVSLLFEVADVYKNHLSLEVMEVNTLAEVLRHQPGNRRACDQLVAKYETAGQWDALVQVLEGLADHTEDTEEEASLRIRLAEICRSKLGDALRAIPHLERYSELNPTDESVLLELVQIYESREEHRLLLRVLDRLVSCQEDEERLATLHAMARLAWDILGDADLTIEVANKLLDSTERKSQRGLQLLEEIHQSREEWDSLIPVLKDRVELTQTKAELIALWLRIGDIQASHIGDVDTALAAYGQARELEPDDSHVLNRLEGLYVEASRFDELATLCEERQDWMRYAELLGQAIADVDETLRRDLHWRIAKTAEDKLSDPIRAVAGFEAVLQLNPSDADAAEALVPYYERDEAYPQLAAVLAVLTETRSGEEGVALLRRLAALHDEELSDLTWARHWSARAVEEEPTDPEIREEFESLCRRADAVNEVINHFLKVAEGAEESLRSALVLRAAEIALTDLRPTHAEVATRLFVELSATDEHADQALQALETLYAEAARFEDLLDVLRKRAERTSEGDEQVAIRLRIAAVQARQIGDLSSAISTYKEVLQSDPNHAEALALLKQAHAEREDWAAVVEVANHEAEVVAEIRPVALYELGQVHAHKLAQMEDALRAYETLLSEFPEHEVVPKAIGHLESILDGSPDRMSAATLLDTAYERLENWDELVRVREILVNEGEQDDERSTRLHSLITIYETHLGEPIRAFSAALRYCEQLPTDESGWDEIERFGQQSGNWRPVSSFYRRAAEAHPENSALTRRLGSVLVQMSDLEGAAVVWRTIWEAVPGDREAADALEFAYGELNDYEALKELLQTRVSHADDDAEAVGNLFKICGVLEREGAPQSAVPYYERVLEIEESNERAFEALRVLLDMASDSEGLAALIRERIRVCPEPDRSTLQLQLGSIRESELNDVVGAVEMYRAVLESGPDAEVAAQAIERVARATVDQPDLVGLRQEIYQVLRARLTDGEDWTGVIRIEEMALADPAKIDERAGRYNAIALLQRDKLEDPTMALESWANAILLDLSKDEYRVAAEALAPAAGAWGRLATVYEQGVEQLPAGAQRTDLRRRLAEIYETELGDSAAAIGHYADALRESPEDRLVIEALERLYLQTAQFKELIEVRVLKAPLLTGDERIAMLRENAAAQRDQLEDLDAAIVSFDAVLHELPGDPDALEALEELYTRLERWESVVDVLSEQTTQTEDDAARRELHYRIGVICRDSIDNPGRAIEAFCAILDIDGKDASTLYALEGLYRDLERWSDLARTLEQQRSLSDEPVLRNEIALRLARVEDEKLGDRTAAIRLYRDVLDYDSGESEAAAALESIATDSEHTHDAIEALLPAYREESRWHDTVRLLEARLNVETEPAAKLNTLDQIRKVLEDKLGDRPAALNAAVRRYSVAAGSVGRDDLERLAEMVGDYRTLGEAYSLVLKSTTDDAERVSLLVRLGTVYRDHLDNIAEAGTAFAEALEVAPENMEALLALEQLYRIQERHDDVLDVLSKRVQIALDTEDLETAMGCLQDQATVYDEIKGDSGAAVELAGRCLELDQTNLWANQILERLLRAEQRWQPLSELLLAQAERADGSDEGAEKRHQLGLVAWQYLGDTEEAVRQFSRVFETLPGNPETVDALEALLDAELSKGGGEAQTSAATALDPQYVLLERWGSLPQVLRLQADAASEPEVSADFMARAAEILQSRLGQNEAAFELLIEVVEKSPARVATWHQLKSLAGEIDRWSLLAARLETEVAQPRVESDVQLELAVLLGGILERGLSDPSAAQATYEAILKLEPTHLAAVDAIERILTQDADWTGLAELYQGQIHATDDESKRLVFYTKVGRLYDGVLYEADEAIAAYTSVLTLSKDHIEANAALERLFEFELRYRELAGLLEQRATTISEPAARADILMRLGATLTHLDEREQAVAVLEEALTLVPFHSEVVGALEVMLQALRAQEDSNELRFKVSDLLESAYDPSKDWRKIVGLLEDRAEISAEPLERSKALKSAGEITEAQGDSPTAAFQFYVRAFQGDPDGPEVLQHLQRLVVITGDYEGLVDAFVSGLPRATNTELAIDLLMNTAGICQEQLKDTRRAVDVLDKVLELDAENRAALERMEVLLRDTDDPARLVKVLLYRAEHSEDLLDRKEFCYQAAEVQESQLGNLEGAGATYRRILDLDPEDIVALESLERLLRKTHQYENLVNILLTKCDVIDNEPEKRKIYLEMAVVYERELSDVDSAIDVYRFLLSSDSEDSQAIESLDRLYEQTERWADLLDVIEAERKNADSDEERDLLDFRTATLLEQAMSDVPRAIEVYRNILERNPSNAPALHALEDLASGDHALAASTVLDAHFRAQNDWKSVIGLLEQRVEADTDRTRRHQSLREMARIYEAELAQPTLAFREMSRAFTERPSDDNLFEELTRLAEEKDMWDALAHLLDQAVEQTPDEARSLRLKAADIYHKQLSDPSKAALRYRQVLEVQPTDKEALSALDALYTAESDWEALADILRRQIEVAETPLETNNLRFRLAYIIETVFLEESQAVDLYVQLVDGEPDDRAVESLERLVRQDVHNAKILPVLVKVYESSDSTSKLLSLYDLSIDFRTEPAERAELLKAMATISSTNEETADRALSYLSRALREAPQDPEVHEKLETLCAGVNAWSELTSLFDKIRSRIEDPTLKGSVLAKLAAWYEQKLGNDALAEVRYRELIELDPGNLAPLESLQEIYDRSGNHRSSVELLFERAQLSSPEEGRALLIKAVSAAEHQLGDNQLAAAGYRRLLELDSEDSEAVLALVRLYGEANEHGPLVEALRRQIEFTEDPAERDRIFRQIGALSEELGDLPGAADAYGRALDRQPDDLELHGILIPIYTALEQWSALGSLLQLRLKFPSSEAERLEVTHRLAQLNKDRFDDPAKAMDLYRRALERTPDSLLILRELATLLKDAEDWEELVSVYRSLETVLLDSPDDRDDLGAVYLDLSTVQNEKLGSTDDAIETLRRHLKTEPDNTLALAQLGGLLEGEERWDEALEVLGVEISLTEQPEAAATLYYRQAQIQRNIGAEDAAVKLPLEHALRLDQTKLDVAEELYQIYTRLEEWESLWSVGSLLANREEDPAKRKERALGLAELAKVHLRDAGRQTKALEVAYVLDSDDIFVVEELANAYLAISAFEKAGPLIDRLIQQQGSSGKASVRAKLQHLRGRVAAGLEQPQHAETAYRAAYKIDPAYLPNLMSLGKLLFSLGNLDEALKFFQMMLLHQMSLKDKGDRVAIHFQMGEIYRLKGDRRRARDLYMRALSIDREHEPSKKGLAEVQ